MVLAACDVPDWLGDERRREPKLPGERIAVLDYDNQLTPDISLEDEDVKVPSVERNKDFQFDVAAQLAGFENLGVTGLESVKSTKVGDGVAFDTILIPPPIVGDGRLFAMDANGYVSAHNASNIDEVYWVSDAPVLEDDIEVSGGGLSYDRGVVYATTGYGAILALVADDGSVLWRRETDAPIRAAPLVADGKLFALSIDNQTLAYNARTGKPLWTHRSIKESAVYLGSVSPSYENGIVVVAYTSGELYALRSEDGSPIWSDSLIVPKRTFAASSLTGIDATPVIKDGVVFGLSNSGLLAANLLSNGRGLWDAEIAGYNTPWAAGEYLFVLTTDHALAAMRRKDGAVRWVTSLKQMEEDDDVTPRLSGPIMINNHLVVATDAGELLFFSAKDGALKKRLEVPEGIRVAPIVANGTLYLLSADATLYSYR